MTTEAAARLYEAQHLREWGGKGWAFFNPKDMPMNELPVIYGFNNGGSPGFMSACLIAEDGTDLGGHLCSSEDYMPHDLGVLEGARADRHEGFRAHHPNGYRMVFVSYSDIPGNAGLQKAIKIALAQDEAKANARLIAASPELLGSLQFAINHLNADTFIGDAIDEFHTMATAAIAKATKP